MTIRSLCVTLSPATTQSAHIGPSARALSDLRKGECNLLNAEHARYTKRAPSPVALEPCSQTRARPRRRQAKAANLQLGDVPTVPWARHGRFWSGLPVSFGSRAPGAPEALHRVSHRGRRRTRSVGCPTAGGALKVVTRPDAPEARRRALHGASYRTCLMGCATAEVPGALHELSAGRRRRRRGNIAPWARRITPETRSHYAGGAETSQSHLHFRHTGALVLPS